ncbi:MAG: STAS domain-containing protein [Cytophagaceae bacterium]|nr:STAS domain-containing protein [Cytophagaceae bacterium]
MDFKTEKNEQYALVHLNEPALDAGIAPDFETLLRVLFREGYSNIIMDLKTVQDIDNQGLGVIRKANRLCLNEMGLLILVTKDDELTETLDSAKIPDLTIMPTVEEAVDAVFMNDLENDFKEEEDTEDYGFGEGEESGGSNKEE